MSSKSNAGSEAPKLLLDTNIYRDLAERKLLSKQDRLDAIARHRDPPLFWACQVTFDELIWRINAERADRFCDYRAALWWMERLCKRRGMAEPLKWALRRGVFAEIVPDDGVLASLLVGVRRHIIDAGSYEQVSANVRAEIDRLRTDYRARIDAWIARRTQVNDVIRNEMQPEGAAAAETSSEQIQPEDDFKVAAESVLEISRKYADDDVAEWGPIRDDQDQKDAQRELIAFEVSLIRKARNPDGYNHANHRSDYNDYWLLAYASAGYTIVTIDQRLLDALSQGACVDARAINLDEGIARAEAWLRTKVS